MFPVVIGALVSLGNQQGFSLWYFSLVFFTVIINHIALNMTDDYFDYLHAVDQASKDEKNPYTGGSGTLTTGVINPRSMLFVFSSLYIFVIIVGIYLSFYRGWPILIFGLVGVLSSIFYTAPPVKFSHHGLGELAMLFNFSFVLGVGSYYVQAQIISLEAIIATLPCGIMLFSMIIINEIPDIKEDTQAGKLTLIARYGPIMGIKLFTASWIVTYTVIIGGVATSILPMWSIICFLSLPFVLRSIRILRLHYKHPQQLITANLSMIIAHAITGLGLILAYAIKGIHSGGTIMLLGYIMIIFFLGYLPAIIPLIFPRHH
jgi:1,4-dihydroxy-2-naphthoate octaprenyltransferase